MQTLLTNKKFILIGLNDDKKVFLIKSLLTVFLNIEMRVSTFQKETKDETQVLYTGPGHAKEAKQLFPDAISILIHPNKQVFNYDYHIESDDARQCFAELASIIFRELGGKVYAYDGVAGGGKGTIARLVAKALGGVHVDSGMFYRLAAYFCQTMNGIAPGGAGFEKKLDELVNTVPLLDVPESILRSPEVDAIVAAWSKIKEVRNAVFLLQMKGVYGSGSAIAVCEGRDLTTKLFRWADAKFFVDCPLEIRAERRSDQNGKSVPENADALGKRDHVDMTRPLNPLFYDKEGGVVLIMNARPLEQVLEEVLGHIAQVAQ